MRFVEAPVVSPTLLGRGPQLAHLGQLIDQLVGGHGGGGLGTGEAGVGKTRLVGEARSLASNRGVRVLHGAAFELDRTLPYGPIADLLREFIDTRAPDEVVDDLGPALVPLARLLPGVAAWLPTNVDASPDQNRQLL